MKQTAIEQAIELIKKDYEVNGRLRPAYVFQTLEKAKEMEKEQIMDAYRKGYIHYLPQVDSEEYYNKTFKSE